MLNNLYNFMLDSIVFLALSFLRGLTILCFWGWFIAPTFRLPDLSPPIAMGLSLLVTFLLHTTGLATDDDDEKPMWIAAIEKVSNCLVFMLYGWLIHLLC